MWLIYVNSMYLGIFPEEWTISTVKLLPKSGGLTNPEKLEANLDDKYFFEIIRETCS